MTDPLIAGARITYYISITISTGRTLLKFPISLKCVPRRLLLCRSTGHGGWLACFVKLSQSLTVNHLNVKSFEVASSEENNYHELIMAFAQHEQVPFISFPKSCSKQSDDFSPVFCLLFISSQGSRKPNNLQWNLEKSLCLRSINYCSYLSNKTGRFLSSPSITMCILMHIQMKNVSLGGGKYSLGAFKFILKYLSVNEVPGSDCASQSKVWLLTLIFNGASGGEGSGERKEHRNTNSSKRWWKLIYLYNYHHHH